MNGGGLVVFNFTLSRLSNTAWTGGVTVKRWQFQAWTASLKARPLKLASHLILFVLLFAYSLATRYVQF
jgi:hypothetical protein